MPKFATSCHFGFTVHHELLGFMSEIYLLKVFEVILHLCFQDCVLSEAQLRCQQPLRERERKSAFQVGSAAQYFTNPVQTSHFKMANEWIEEDWGNASEILIEYIRIYHNGSDDLLIVPVTFITSSRRKLPASSPWSLRAWTFAMPPAGHPGHLGSSPCSWANDFQSQCQPGESYS